MEITLEQVERLREKMDVSYGEARAALEHSGGDLLGALIWLEEKQGKRTEKGGFYSTDSSARREAEDPDASFFHDEFAFTSISEDQLFYLNENGEPVVVFEKYAIAPGYMGMPEFTVPLPAE